jgi:NADH dehydrogenase (ubiquinone) 1 beta subcomplex subunit 3
MPTPSPLYPDPWAKLEAWRKHPVYSRTAQIRGLFPGFGIAVVAFSTYVVFDNFVLGANKKKDDHH